MPSRFCLLGVLVVAALATAGLAGGAGGSQGLIVFSTFLPEYPLPDNFQVDRMYVVGRSGSTTELRAGDVLSSDGSRVASVRAGSELWVASVDGRDARRIVAARDPMSDVTWSENGSRLAFVAGGL